MDNLMKIETVMEIWNAEKPKFFHAQDSSFITLNGEKNEKKFQITIFFFEKYKDELSKEILKLAKDIEESRKKESKEK